VTATATLPVLNYIAGEWVSSPSGETTETGTLRDPKEVSRARPQRRPQRTSARAIDAPTPHSANGAARRRRARDIVRKGPPTSWSDAATSSRASYTQEEGKVLAESLAEVDRAIANVRFAAAQGTRLTGEPSVRAAPHLYLVRSRSRSGSSRCDAVGTFPIGFPAWKDRAGTSRGQHSGLQAGVAHTALRGAGGPVLRRRRTSERRSEHGARRGRDLSRAITSDDRVKAISFTGSSAVGRRLYTQAAERLCKVQLEMGGKNAVIVMDDATSRRPPNPSPREPSARPGSGAPRRAARRGALGASRLHRPPRGQSETWRAAMASNRAFAWGRSSTRRSCVRSARRSTRANAPVRKCCAMAALRRGATSVGLFHRAHDLLGRRPARTARAGRDLRPGRERDPRGRP